MSLNAFTVDLEDWAHGLLGGDTPITPRVVRNVDRVLELLAEYDVRATFFALGRVCEKFPELLPRVAAAGHEIASHGYNHGLLFNMTPDEFRDDVQRSIDVIGGQTGVRPIGYRAPAFSMMSRAWPRELGHATQCSLWAGPILAELGFKYSSSIFPIRGRRYGISNAPRYIFNWRDWRGGMQHGQEDLAMPPDRASKSASWPCTDLIEFPLTTLQLFGRRFPVCGGGYLRLLPSWVHAAAIRQANRAGHPAVIYMHPYELDVHELRDLGQQGWRFDRKTALMQSLFRRRVRPRLSHLLRSFQFAPMSDVLNAVPV